MPAPLSHIETSPELPRDADVVVIGGGIIGVFAAYYLTLRGLSVALVEKGRIGAEQSSRNWGWCRQQNRDARELPMATRSLDLWESFGTESGQSTGFSRCGLLYLSNDEAELEGWARWRDFARTVGVTTQMLDGTAATQRGVATGRSWKGGVFSPTDGIADPARAAPAVARAMLRRGGTVHQMCAARGLETEGGRVSAVVTERGTIRTRTAILAGGAWSSSFCHQAGIRLPLASIRSSILSVSEGAKGLPDALHTAAVSVTRRGDGGYTLAISGRGRVDPTAQQLRFAPQFLPMFLRRWRSLLPGGLEGVWSGHETLRRWRPSEPTPMERMRILDPAPDQNTIELTHRRALELLPALKDTKITAAWGGYIDSTPDGVPVIGETSGLPGLILAAGFSGHGFGIGPGAGHLIADLVTGAAPIVDPQPYRPNRFAGLAVGKVSDF
ncbi:glycine/D-amino acid oxidase-like deaminating enzyme [Bradyrhizobium sp. cir1]|uniref:NAD(P)/FAD-dependent oxidoreductase n=1 Tax=Bradyrhizobium sp. cir1 TaxID=1445730 RepID=UPI0016065819|nr:FAD-binding oxidoreductase [Bradyrhizobium sp. cir1]MBB4369668.1 glycine/D-amino acid oxidase-like deaminating enzyme [Bradyrhizobium sp. cir1]